MQKDISVCVPAQETGLAQAVAEMKRRQASYMRREDKQKQRIETLQTEVTKTRAEHSDSFLETEKQCDTSLVAHMELAVNVAKFPLLTLVLQVSSDKNERRHPGAD